MILAKLNFVAVDAFAQILCCLLSIFEIIQMIQAIDGDREDLPGRLENCNMLVLKLPQISGELLFSGVDATFSLEELVHPGNIVRVALIWRLNNLFIL